MAAKMKKVDPAARARPIRTFYDNGERAAHSKTAKGAARAAFRWLTDNKHFIARVEDERGRPIATLESYSFTLDTTMKVHDKKLFEKEYGK